MTKKKNSKNSGVEWYILLPVLACILFAGVCIAAGSTSAAPENGGSGIANYREMFPDVDQEHWVEKILYRSIWVVGNILDKAAAVSPAQTDWGQRDLLWQKWLLYSGGSCFLFLCYFYIVFKKRERDAGGPHSA